MTPASLFLIAAGVMVVLVLVVLLPPLWRAPKPSAGVERRVANLAIFRQQLAELEHDRNDGSLADTDFDQAKRELQRRLLDEVQPDRAAPRLQGGHKTALTLLVLLPLAAIGGYGLLGNPQALAPVNVQGQMDATQIDAMLARLAERLKSHPEDSKGWIILARSYKTLGRFAEAADAYSHGGEMLNADPALLADYAEVLVQQNGGVFTEPANALLARALKIDPNEPQTLFLAGAAANDRRDFAAVVDYWSRLLVQLEAGSEEAMSLGTAIEKARQVLARGGSAPGNAQAPTAAATSLAISGEVTISDRIAAQTKPDDLLFIFARADEGSRMPLAVLRRQVADLPLRFRLDDSLGLPGGQKLSESASVTIEARVAKAGMAQSASGDLFGVVMAVKPGSTEVKVVIDQIQP